MNPINMSDELKRTCGQAGFLQQLTACAILQALAYFLGATWQ